LGPVVLIPPIVGWSNSLFKRSFGLERRGHRPSHPFRQRTLDVAREPTTQRLCGHPITDLHGRDVRREIGQSGISQPLESGWRNGLLKVSQNCAPQKAGIDLNLCARVASIHAASPMVFVRSVRTP
jgi:hypothetical protein